MTDPPGPARAVRLEDALRQAITLHRRAHTLHSEFRAAERALPKRTMRPISHAARGQTQLSSAEGAEADLDNGHG